MSQEREQLAAFVRRWAIAGPMLEDALRQELVEMSDAEHREAVRDLLQLSEKFTDDEPAPATSGLVEQQRLFAKLRRSTQSSED